MDTIEFSDFGKKLCGESGILQLMDDLGKPLPKNIPSFQLGGGNPASIPEIEKMYRSRMEFILNHSKRKCFLKHISEENLIPKSFKFFKYSNNADSILR